MKGKKFTVVSILFVMSVFVLGFTFLISSCGKGPQKKVQIDKGPFAVHFPMTDPLCEIDEEGLLTNEELMLHNTVGLNAAALKPHMIDTDFTVEGWVKAVDDGVGRDGAGVILSFGVIDGGLGFALYLWEQEPSKTDPAPTQCPSNAPNGKCIKFVTYDLGADLTTKTSDDITGVAVANNDIVDGNWHHVAATLSGTTMTVYIDGAVGTESGEDNIGACSITTTTSCREDGDCPGGETCAGDGNPDFPNPEPNGTRLVNYPEDVLRFCSVTGVQCLSFDDCLGGTCSVTTTTSCRFDSECPSGTCSIAGTDCRKDSDCPGVETCDGVIETCGEDTCKRVEYGADIGGNLSSFQTGSLIKGYELGSGPSQAFQKITAGFTYDDSDLTIDEVRLWNTAKTQQEIQNCMNTELGNGGDCSFAAEDLIGYWRFNAGEGVIANDFSGKGVSGSKIRCTSPGGDGGCGQGWQDIYDPIGDADVDGFGVKIPLPSPVCDGGWVARVPGL